MPLAKRQQVKVAIEASDSSKLYGDPVKFVQLVTNLVVNAIDAYPTAARQTEKRLVQIQVAKRSPWLEIRVSDNGKGITAAQLPHLFEPFYTTKTGRKRGLGIGLAMVKQYVEIDFHGSTEVSTLPSKGTQFLVRLRLP